MTTGTAWTFVAFPLVLDWQADFASLAFYFPELECGRLQGAPPACRWHSRFGPPRYHDLPALLKGFRPGELSQWRAFLDFLASQESEEEDLKAAIKGQLLPVLPPAPEPEFLWSLAWLLEQTLRETAAGLAQVRRQEEALSAALGGELEEAVALGALEPSFSPNLELSPPDPELSRIRLLFWQQLLEVTVDSGRVGLVLESAAGEPGPRLLWQEAQAAGEAVSRWSWRLPGPSPLPLTEETAAWQEKFQAALADLLNAALTSPTAAASPATAMAELLDQLPVPGPGTDFMLELWSHPPEALAALPRLLLFAAPAT